MFGFCVGTGSAVRPVAAGRRRAAAGR